MFLDVFISLSICPSVFSVGVFSNSKSIGQIFLKFLGQSLLKDVLR